MYNTTYHNRQRLLLLFWLVFRTHLLENLVAAGTSDVSIKQQNRNFSFPERSQTVQLSTINSSLTKTSLANNSMVKTSASSSLAKTSIANSSLAKTSTADNSLTKTSTTNCLLAKTSSVNAISSTTTPKIQLETAFNTSALKLNKSSPSSAISNIGSPSWPPCGDSFFDESMNSSPLSLSHKSPRDACATNYTLPLADKTNLSRSSYSDLTPGISSMNDSDNLSLNGSTANCKFSNTKFSKEQQAMLASAARKSISTINSSKPAVIMSKTIEDSDEPQYDEFFDEHVENKTPLSDKGY